MLNRAINEEVGALLYDRQTLRFTFQTDTMGYGLTSYVLVESSHGWRTRLPHYDPEDAWMYFGVHDAALLQHFTNVPYHRFGEVQIDVLAPEHYEPVDFIYLWKSIVWLLKTLCAREPPKVWVRFIESCSRSWWTDEWSFLDDCLCEWDSQSKPYEFLFLPFVWRGLSDRVEFFRDDVDQEGDALYLMRDMISWSDADALLKEKMGNSGWRQQLGDKEEYWKFRIAGYPTLQNIALWSSNRVEAERKEAEWSKYLDKKLDEIAEAEAEARGRRCSSCDPW